MPERPPVLVTNTTPLIALAAATGSLDVLRFLYRQVVVPYEVAQEVRAGGRHAFGVDAFQQATWLDIQSAPVVLQPFLHIHHFVQRVSPLAASDTVIEFFV